MKPDDAYVHFDSGLEDFENGLCDEAIRHFEEAISLKPLAKAHFYLGRAYFKKGLDDETVRHFEEAVKLDPNYADAHHCLVWMYYKKNGLDSDLAEEHCNAAVGLEPASKEVHQFLDDFIARGRS